MVKTPRFDPSGRLVAFRVVRAPFAQTPWQALTVVLQTIVLSSMPVQLTCFLNQGLIIHFCLCEILFTGYLAPYGEYLTFHTATSRL